MNKPLLRVDFNNMIEDTLVMLTQARTFDGQEIALVEGLEIDLYEDDLDEFGKPDQLIASGKVERNTFVSSSGWGATVKWNCRIDAKGIRHRSDLDQH